MTDGHWEGFVEGEFRIRDATGSGDARLVLETQFSGTKDPGRTVWGARVQFILPTGHYDGTKAINLGANRWGAIPEVGFSYPAGKWDLEGALAAWIFGHNDDYLGMRLQQNPLLVAKFHAIRAIRPGFWWALAAGYGHGGRTTVDDVPRDTLQSNWRLAFVMAYPIRANQGITVDRQRRQLRCRHRLRHDQRRLSILMGRSLTADVAPGSKGEIRCGKSAFLLLPRFSW